MNQHTTLAGRVIEYPDPPPAVAAFLARAKAAAEDPAVDKNAMIALVYGPDNPVLDHDYFPGRAYVTPAVWADPLYHVLADLIGVKEVRLGLVDLEKAHARYTVDVPTAARQLGLTPQAVRSAIEAYRLSAIYKGGQWWVAPEAIASFKVSTRGRPRTTSAPARAPVTARVGGAKGKGASLSVRIVGGNLLLDRKDLEATLARFPADWTSAVVRTTSDDGTRAFVIEPAAGEPGVIEHAGLYVRGPFRITKRINNSKAAGEAWRAAGRPAPAGATGEGE